jgi:hypothetical protein
MATMKQFDPPPDIVFHITPIVLDNEVEKRDGIGVLRRILKHGIVLHEARDDIVVLRRILKHGIVLHEALHRISVETMGFLRREAVLIPDFVIINAPEPLFTVKPLTDEVQE